MNSIIVPLWLGVLGVVGTIIGAFITGFYLLKTKRVEVAGTGTNGAIQQLLLNAPALLTKAQELLNANETLKDEKRQRDQQIEDLSERVGGLETQIQALTARCDVLAKQAERLPALEAENADLRRLIETKDIEIDRTRIERDTALRAQERAEGGLMQAQRTISEKVCAAPETSSTSTSEH